MKSIGEKRVGIDFEEQATSLKEDIKTRCAEAINMVDNFKEYKTTPSSPSVEVPTADAETMRIVGAVQTNLEMAAMWADKLKEDE